MSKPNTQTTTQRLPPTEEQLKIMGLKPCRNIIDTGKCHHGDNCYFNHNVGGRAVQHDPRSHKQIPPTKPALPTEADILASILQKEGLSKNVKRYVDRTKSFELLKGFNSMLKSFDELSSRDSLSAKDIADALSNFKKVADKFPNDLKSLIEFLSTNIDMLSDKKKFKVSDLKATVEDLKTTYNVSSNVSDQLKEYQKQCELHAKTLSLDPLAQAREKPDGIPTPNFLDHLEKVCGLWNNEGYKSMRDQHNTLGVCSPYRNGSFLGVLDIYNATKEANKLLEAHRLKEIEDRKVAEARAKLLQECLTKSNPSLKIAFRILQAQSEFVKFIQALSDDDRDTLVSVFGSFMSYLAHSCDKKEAEITSEFLSTMYVFHKVEKGRWKHHCVQDKVLRHCSD